MAKEKQDVDSTLTRALRTFTGVSKAHEQTTRLVVRLVAGLYLWALLLSMEVFDVLDIDIQAGDNAPELSVDHVIAHGHNIIAVLVLLTGIVAAGRHFWKAARGKLEE